MRSILGDIRRLQSMDENELYSAAKEHRAPIELGRYVAERAVKVIRDKIRPDGLRVLDGRVLATEVSLLLDGDQFNCSSDHRFLIEIKRLIRALSFTWRGIASLRFFSCRQDHSEQTVTGEVCEVGARCKKEFGFFPIVNLSAMIAS